MAESNVIVILDNTSEAYYPGERVVGKVVCTFVAETTVRSITVRYKGAAKTKWTVSHGKSRTTYRARETYFLKQATLLGGGEGNTRLAGGVYSYPFSYVLPVMLPSSFNGSHGRVTYSIKAVVDRPWKFDYSFKFILRVVVPVILNSIPGLRQPTTESLTKDAITCFCWNSGPISVTASLPVRGFVRGQTMDIRCYVENMSNLNVENVKFNIVQLREYIGESCYTIKRKSEQYTMACHCESGVEAHGEKSLISLITIPGDMDFPRLELCKIITLSYCLQVVMLVELTLPRCYSNIKLNIPITMGTVPLSGTDPDHPSASALPTEGAPALPNAPTFNNNSDPSVPPSYDEAIQLRQ